MHMLLLSRFLYTACMDGKGCILCEKNCQMNISKVLPFITSRWLMPAKGACFGSSDPCGDAPGFPEIKTRRNDLQRDWINTFLFAFSTVECRYSLGMVWFWARAYFAFRERSVAAIHWKPLKKICTLTTFFFGFNRWIGWNRRDLKIQLLQLCFYTNNNVPQERERS